MADVTASAETEAYAPIPRHIAIIMDGNNRWARERNVSGATGHRAGVETIRSVLKVCREKGVEVLTLFAFSSENWRRPSTEVSALMQLFGNYLKSEVKKLHEDNVRLRFIGARDRLSRTLVRQMEAAESLTRDNTGATLVIAVDYGGQWDIANAARALAREVAAGRLAPESIDGELLGQHVALADLPPPDMCIRTADEQRISNFLLWQLAYAEFYFTDTLWPDFSEADMLRALDAYARRDRRFGGRKLNAEPAQYQA